VIHFIYSHDLDRPHAAPWSIGNHITEAFWASGDVAVHHDWEETSTIQPKPGDVLLGHPHPLPGRIMANSLSQPGWARTIVMCPFNGDPQDRSWLAEAVDRADAFLPICGPYWAARLPTEWKAKSAPLDMAVDLDAFPLTKEGWRPRGERKFLYIGCTVPSKGPEQLAAIAAATGWRFSHVGYGSIAGWKTYGYKSRVLMQEISSAHDFLLMAGRHDANPTVVLEAIGWGLIPILTPQCGWGSDIAGWRIPLDDTAQAVQILERAQQAPASLLTAIQQRNRELVKNHYTWERFCDTVVGAVSG